MAADIDFVRRSVQERAGAADRSALAVRHTLLNRSSGTMKPYSGPSFQDRVGRAAEAKQKALDNLRAKPAVDEEIVAERQAARLKREAAEAEKRAARKAAAEAAKQAKAAAKAEVQSKAASAPAPLSEADKKLARDARYAARKSRK
ncbi:DUF6481 family protein [Sphingomonas sp. LY54]|uniref:DUF6481 family protein n=1 Tax=Sphingomonas sp. LY54 TaxID=3095343 RepID=UPI002D7949E4|nr:DUF6481 family protein [Sphingomonas sp. LY54]WRP30051.1 DUF6481 family protein [Sphingomonas sp. LY54]